MKWIDPGQATVLDSWWGTLRKDRLAQLVLAVFLANAFYSYLPSSVDISYYITIISLSIAVVALRWGHSKIPERNERLFWNDFTVAYVSWLLAELIVITLSDRSRAYPSTTISLTADVGYGLYYIGCAFALDRQPHRGEHWDPTGLRRLLGWPVAVVFVFCVFLYLDLIPAATNPELYESYVPATLLYFVLDALLAARLVYLLRSTNASPRWTSLYSLLLLTFLISIVNDCQGMIEFEDAESVWGVPALWNLMIVSFVAAVRLRHYPFSETEKPAPAPADRTLTVEPRWRTLFLALLLPFGHFLGYGIGVLDESSERARSILIALWLLLTGIFAFFQYQLLERHRRKLQSDRNLLSDELAWRKKTQEEKERLLAEIEAKNAELERLTYSLSHDLKGPLVTIQGFLGYLEQDVTGGNREQVDEDISRIRTAADKMRQLLDELLELSRIGHLKSKTEEVSLFELAQEAVGLLAGPIAERGVEVTVSPDLPMVVADRPRLLAVFQNLVDNAVKFMGSQSEPRIEIGAVEPRVRSRDDGLVFYVRDNGIGIDSRYHKKIFGLFEQLDQSAGGSGAGLTIVERVVRSHGGRVWVESESREGGSVFYFTLQRVPEDSTSDL